PARRWQLLQRQGQVTTAWVLRSPPARAAAVRSSHARQEPLPPTTSEVFMSRYSLPPQQPGLTVTVGWDNPLGTFFAQVFDPSTEEDADACPLWIGTAPGAIPTVAALQAQLVGWATTPPAILDCLTHDQQAATPPTPLQQWALQLLHDAGERRPDCT